MKQSYQKIMSEADSIRQQLFSMGVEIFDSKDGSEWKPVSS